MAKFQYVDGNSIGRANHSTTKLRVGNRETQAIYGFLRSMRASIEAFPGSKPLVLWDSRAVWRYELYPHYKSNRDDSEEKVQDRKSYEEQKPDIIKAMFFLGVSQLRVTGREADDLAGYLSVKAAKIEHEVVLVTGDQDWLQLVNEYVRWYDPVRDQHVNYKTFAEFTGYANTRQFLEGKALTGDTSDTIGGVGGIGKKGAPEFLLTYGSVEQFFDLADKGALPKKLPIVLSRFANNEYPTASRAKNPPPPEKMRDAFYRNMRLMNLQDVPAPNKEFVKVTRGKFDEDKFRALCEELAFSSILKQFDTWVRPFKNIA